MRFRFADLELDVERRELSRAGSPIELQPKVFDLLRFLVETRARLVTRQELLDAVWDGTIVGDAAISRAIREVRRAVGDDGEQQRIIKTMHARGFRFVAPVEVVDASAPPKPPAAPEPVVDDFVGRSAALRQLEAARIALVTGEAGIGKSVLVERFAREQEARAQVHIARCSEADGVPALWPWEQLVRALDAPVPAELQPIIGVGAVADEPSAKFRLYDGCARFFLEQAKARPLLLVIEDLQLADAESVALLSHLAPRIRNAPIGLIVTTRDAGTVLAGATVIALEGFEAREVAQFFERQTGTAPAPQTAVSLQQWTGGNPLFLSHLVHLTEESGEGSRSARLPRALREAVDQTVEVLSSPAKAVLETAAVAGVEFRLVVLAQAMGTVPADLLDALGEALEHRLVRRVIERVDAFAFVHGVVRDALYAQLPLGERARRHVAIGDALESVYAASKTEQRVEELAHHFLRAAAAGRADQAVMYASLAGDHAVARAAFEHATTFYKSALDALALASDPQDRGKLLVRLGSALGRSGRLAEAGHVFREAAIAPDVAPLSISELTVRDVPALRSSFEHIVKNVPEVTTRFYDRLFAENPDLRPLFRRHMPVQAKMMNDTLLAIIDRLEDAPWLRSSLAALGARHVEYGVTEEMYERVGGCLIATLADSAGPDVWTPPIAAAWRQAFDAITTLMMQGARARSSAA
jgi:DNA-binding winged helix-turn-helix (wHTH) protein/hemoglobin-like flavoprotein